MNFTFHVSDDACTVYIRGTIDAGFFQRTTVLRDHFVRGRLIFDLEDVTNVTSSGCGEWARAMESLASDYRVELVRCAVTFIDCCHLFPAMLGAPAAACRVESLWVPYSCRNVCGSFECLVAANFVADARDPPGMHCPRCGIVCPAGPIPERYEINYNK